MGIPALFKTTIVIWSKFQGDQSELSDLAREAEEGNAYCSKSQSVKVADPESDPDWDGTDFFEGDDGDDEEDEDEDS